MAVMKFGYARVSTDDQELARQIDALNNYGVDKIYKEKITGTKASRPELDKLKNAVREGDSVIIESLSRLGRSTKDLLALLEEWDNQGVKLVSLKENIDTTKDYADGETKKEQEKNNYERNVILVQGSNGTREALLKTTIEPKVKGVVIVCQGGENIEVEKRVIDAVTTALDISSSKICVAKLSDP